MNWVNQEKVEEQRIGLENRIAAIVGAPVRINLDGGTLTMLPESFGGFLASAGIVIVIIFMGMTMIPHLILEEKTARTMDALLVSPASTSQIVIAKALAGLFYCLVMVILIIILNYNLILQWGLALLSALLITLFSIVFGLILGSQLESPQQVRLVASLIMVPMFLPVFLSFMVGLVPAWLIAILRWLPPVATSNLIRFSFTDHIDPSQIIPEVGLLLASIFILLIYEVWLLRRADH
jgi:ABC-type Na+ efflux pump permease subunit